MEELARTFHESLAATTDMAVLPGVLGCRPLRRTIQVRLGTNTLRLPGGTPIFFALAALRSVPQAGSQFRGLATAIHEISGLATEVVTTVHSIIKIEVSDGSARHNLR
ncbi:MAG: hypothetical protein OEU80_00105 [Deltaproteobacteria bacterium]|nr:hypothetical protein [Deltaproteobacteria bacterium]MDH3800474.1 hypothetical protein [Deltaproteobacteria bacterium]MDH3851174.1 hypothetical protein [Deltaproteobacteria bacterium]MDH3927660.1 hypothetical protein [Deltaproteobacteria bacterium]MDH3949746.1 hypothetical protein [Deltaproteobacteria bacterium]